jgi:tRNA modification GTPase
LLDQAGGALRRVFERVRQLVEQGHRGAALELVDQLLERADLGRHLTAPFHVVLTGRPNVGKSSLLNALLGYRRAIVFDQPGTTRDVVTAATVVDGWPIELSDTAGLRTSGDELETAGVAAAGRRLEEADLVVAVFDLTEPWTAEDAAILTAHPHAVVVLNKADATEVPNASRPAGLRTSAVSGLGIEALLTTIATRLVPQPPQPGEAVPFTSRQIDELRRLRETTSA